MATLRQSGSRHPGKTERRMDDKMGQAVPLIRALSLLPTLAWLDRHNYPLERLLGQFGLAVVPDCNPMRPVPLLKVGALLGEIARLEGPDVACRIVAETGNLELAQIGRIALGTRTPSEALARIAFGLPFYCSHELVTAEPTESGLSVRHAYGVRLDPVIAHLLMQYTLAVLDRLCQLTGAAKPRFSQVHIAPHPEAGVSHLAPWFGEGIVFANKTQSLWVEVPDHVANGHFPKQTRDRSEQMMKLGFEPLRGDGSFSSSVRILLKSLLDDGVPTLEQMSDAAGMSPRTFQRRLQEEHMSFKGMIDELRREAAVEQLQEGQENIAAIAANLGYTKQGSLTRSMRRWLGHTPSTLRKKGH